MLAWPSKIPCVKLNPSAAVLVPVDGPAGVERAIAAVAVAVAVAGIGTVSEGGTGSDAAAARDFAAPGGAGAECACISSLPADS